MTSATLRGWRPSTPASFARPVQDESATGGLTGCETPDGHGVLVWVVSGGVHFAVVNSPRSFIIDDVVPLADVQVMMTAGTIYGACVFSHGGATYCLVGLNTPHTFSVDIYEADDPNEPTSWSIRSTVYSEHHDAGAGSFGLGGGQAPALILDNGRWVVGTKTGGSPLDNTFQAWVVRIFTSDDVGLTWSQRLYFEHPNIFPRTEFAATQMAQDPVTGNLWWSSGTSISATDMNNLWRSTDGGGSWSHNTSDLGAERLIPAIDNNTQVYALGPGGSVFEYDGSGFLFSDWVDTGQDWVAPGVTPDGLYEQTVHATTTAHGVYFFLRDQVMFVRRGGWHTGFTGN